MDGFLNIVKPSGPTSHDIVNKIKWLFNKKEKVGHAGTLDPIAEGVLVVAIGKATRAIEYIDLQVKTYEATMRLGMMTDTQDITGKIISEKKDFLIDESKFNDVVSSFIGKIKQIPPMISAIKHDGQPLYKIAREGRSVERKAREIEIYDIKSSFVAEGDIPLTITCSSGTYIRTLCHDIGQRLGCGAVMSSLKRTRVGEFLIKNSVAFERFKDSCDREKMLMPMSFALRNMNKMELNAANIKRISVGLCVRAPKSWDKSLFDEPVVFTDESGIVVGIGKYENNLLQPVKVFVERESL